MDLEQKIAWGKQMGEIYRLQKRTSPDLVSVSDSTIYALLNGLLPVIEEQLEVQLITQEDITAVMGILNVYFIDEQKLEQLSGYYEIEPELQKADISRIKAITILTYLYNNGQFTEVIDKFNSSASPVECKRFTFADYDV